MATGRIVTTGVVKGNTIVLEGEVPLPDGARVRVTVAVEEKSLEERRLELYKRLEAAGLITVPKTQRPQLPFPKWDRRKGFSPRGSGCRPHRPANKRR